MTLAVHTITCCLCSACLCMQIHAVAATDTAKHLKIQMQIHATFKAFAERQELSRAVEQLSSIPIYVI